MGPPADPLAPLAVTRACVVPFRADTAVEQGHLTGRVAHVVSGQATDLQSLETLLAFMARVLRAERERSAEPSRTRREGRGSRSMGLSTS